MRSGDLPQRLHMALTREAGGERVLWQGGCIPRIELRSFGIYLFAVPWTAFSLFWTAMAAAGSRATWDAAGPLSLALPLFGVPFIAVGLGMMAMPFWGYWNAPRTLYAVTERRLLRLTLGKSLKVHSVPGERIGPVESRELPDGSGTLSFAVRVGLDSDNDRVVDRFEMADIAGVFEAAREVERMRARLAARDPVSS